MYSGCFNSCQFTGLSGSLLHAFLVVLEFLSLSQLVLVLKNPPVISGDIRDMGSVPGLGRSPGRGHGNPLCILAWKIPWKEEPGEPRSIELDMIEATQHEACRLSIMESYNIQFLCLASFSFFSLQLCVSFSFLTLKNFKLECNCFIMSCWFMLYNMNQL